MSANTKLTVLSPHRDDAAFSLFVCLSEWRRRPVRIRVVNFFTVSNYAPRAGTSDAHQASAIRKREDRRVLSSISRQTRVIDRHLLDAPLRLGIEPSAICDLETHALSTETDLEQIGALLRFAKSELVLAPLGLGGHVDHEAVYRAVTREIPGSNLAFYEDLPYAAWTPDEALRDKIRQSVEITRTPLKPLIVRTPHSVSRKRQAIARYWSQIDPADAALMAGRCEKYGSGERIWIPRNSKRWAWL